jgi:hypothetical protein
MRAYIDVRGPWPVFIYNMTVVVLTGANRNITVEQAIEQFGQETK